MTYRIPLVVNSWGPEERATARAVIDSDRHTMGVHVRKFEEAFAQLVEAKHAVMVTSGSSALELAAYWYTEHLGQNTVVIPAVTWPTTVWPFIRAGCKVILADVDPETLLMQHGEHYGFCHVPVHLMGNRCEITEKMRIIEDSCEAIQPVRGTIACYSMFFSHHLNTVEGGVVCTNDDHVADWLRSARAHGWIRDCSPAYKAQIKAAHAGHEKIDERFLFENMGWNMKPTELAAAIGIIQLGKLKANMEARLHAYLYMAEGLASLANQIQPMRLVSNPAPFAFPLICRDAATKARLVAGLEGGQSIETRPIAGGNLARQPAFRRYRDKWTAGELPGANKVHDCGFFVGLYPGMDCDYMVESIRKILA